MIFYDAFRIRTIIAFITVPDYSFSFGKIHLKSYFLEQFVDDIVFFSLKNILIINISLYISSAQTISEK